MGRQDMRKLRNKHAPPRLDLRRNVPRLCPTCCNGPPDFGQFWPILAQFWPNFGDVCPSLAKAGPSLAKNWPRFGQFQPDLSDNGRIEEMTLQQEARNLLLALFCRFLFKSGRGGRTSSAYFAVRHKSHLSRGVSVLSVFRRFPGCASAMTSQVLRPLLTTRAFDPRLETSPHEEWGRSAMERSQVRRGARAPRLALRAFLCGETGLGRPGTPQPASPRKLAHKAPMFVQLRAPSANVGADFRATFPPDFGQLHGDPPIHVQYRWPKLCRGLIQEPASPGAAALTPPQVSRPEAICGWARPVDGEGAREAPPNLQIPSKTGERKCAKRNRAHFKHNYLRNRVSSIGFGRELAPPAWRDEEGLFMLLLGLLEPGTS